MKTGTSKTVHPLYELKNAVNQDLDAVNQLILDLAKSGYTDLIPDITHHLTASGGKRIRPILTLAAANMFNCTNGHHISLATAVEFIHTATLLHDDVIDASDMRRGIPTANNIWGGKASILVGDYLFSQAFKLMVHTDSIRALDVLSSASAIIAESEVWQLDIIGDIELTIEQYLKLIHAKTAVLFSAACNVGALVAGADEANVNAVADYGLYLGICFQIVDDVLDYIASDTKFGKKVGGDFREGKVTLPIIMALPEMTENEKAQLSEALSGTEHRREAEFHKILELLYKYKAFDKALAVAKDYMDKGLSALASIPDNHIKQLLQNLIIHCIERQY